MIARLCIYFSGLFIISIGINLTIISGLGVSPATSLTLPLSQISGMSLGTVTVIMYIGFIAIQKCLLGSGFKAKSLLQLPFSIVFGFFIDLTGNAMGRWIVADGYAMRLALNFSGIIACSFGATLYIAMDFVLNPPEGLYLAFSTKLGKDFGTVKIIIDCVFVICGAIVSLFFFHNISAIREGTIIAALSMGKLMSLFARCLNPWFMKVKGDNL